MTAGRKQRAAALSPLGVPAELTVPRPDAVVIVDLAIVQFTEQPAIQQGLQGKELVGKTALEANTHAHSRPADRLANEGQLPGREAKGFLDDQMLARARGAKGLGRMEGGETAERHGMDIRIGQQVIQIAIDPDITSVPGTQFRWVELSR